jgi:hypothetical protein
MENIKEVNAKFKEYVEGNIIIAKFMGARIEHDYSFIENVQDGLGYYFLKENAPENDLRYSTSGIKYHTSWDWLMPVVEKIENFGNCDIQIHSHIFYINFENGNYKKDFHRYENLTKLEMVWLAVVEFIKWYDETKNTNVQ